MGRKTFNHIIIVSYPGIIAFLSTIAGVVKYSSDFRRSLSVLNIAV